MTTTPHPTPEERYDEAKSRSHGAFLNRRRPGSPSREDYFRDEILIAIREAEAAGEARGRAAHLSIISEWLDVGMLKLRAGELSAQEIRTVIAVLTAIAAAVRARTDKENSDG